MNKKINEAISKIKGIQWESAAPSHRVILGDVLQLLQSLSTGVWLDKGQAEQVIEACKVSVACGPCVDDCSKCDACIKYEAVIASIQSQLSPDKAEEPMAGSSMWCEKCKSCHGLDETCEGEGKGMTLYRVVQLEDKPKCGTCKGTGSVKETQFVNDGDAQPVDIQCPSCNGTGERKGE